MSVYKQNDTLEYKGNKCILKEYAKTGSTFIEVEMMPESTQEVFRMEYWYIEYEDKNLRSPLCPVPFKYLDYVGIKTSSYDDIELDEDESTKVIKDKFLVANGIEIY